LPPLSLRLIANLYPQRFNMSLNIKTIASSFFSLDILVTTLAGVAMLLAVAYGYFVSSTIFNMVHYRATIEAIARTSTELGILEANYLTLGKSMTIERAYKLGLTDATKATYLVVDTSERGSVLALDTY